MIRDFLIIVQPYNVCECMLKYIHMYMYFVFIAVAISFHQSSYFASEAQRFMNVTLVSSVPRAGAAFT